MIARAAHSMFAMERARIRLCASSLHARLTCFRTDFKMVSSWVPVSAPEKKSVLRRMNEKNVSKSVSLFLKSLLYFLGVSDAATMLNNMNTQSTATAVMLPCWLDLGPNNTVRGVR